MTIKAAVINKFGDVNVLCYEDIQKPSPKPGHVLIKVLAAGVNRLDHYIREGSIVPELPFPHILGADAAGEVAELGEGVSGFETGERVIVAPGYPQKEEECPIRPVIAAPSFALPGLHISGTYTQFMEVPAYAVIKDETGLKPEEAATLPVALATAVHALKEIGEVNADDKVLIHSGASGSGSMQIQVAKALGAEVATSVRNDAKGEFAKTLGADLVINTTKEDFVERIKEWTGGAGADVGIDNLGGDVLANSIEAARPMGVIVAFGFAAGTEVKFDIRSLFFSQKKLRGSMSSDIEDFNWGLEQVRAGRIKPILDHTLPLSQTSEAHRRIATNHVAGKIALLPGAEEVKTPFVLTACEPRTSHVLVVMGKVCPEGTRLPWIVKHAKSRKTKNKQNGGIRMKAAIIVLSDPMSKSEEALGRVFNALAAAYDFKNSGSEVTILFQGTGTRWIGELQKEDHPAHVLFEAVRDRIAGVSCACADVFGATEEAEKSGFDLVKDNAVPDTGGLPSLHKLIDDGYTVLSF